MYATVAAAVKSRALVSGDLRPNSQYYLTPKASETADAISFFDELFDSINGSALLPKPGKELRCAVTQKSKHVNIWNGDGFKFYALHLCRFTKKSKTAIFKKLGIYSAGVHIDMG